MNEQNAEPSFDQDGYPTDETLERVRTWEIKSTSDCIAAMDYAGKAWRYLFWTKRIDFDNKQTRYDFWTGGWSGNESIVAAIEANRILKALGAYSWQRGGQYVYLFSLAQEADK